MTYDTALDLPRDEDGRVVGFQVGKAARLSDWYSSREKLDTETLINRLRVANRMREIRSNPERLEQLHAYLRDYSKRPEVHGKNMARQRTRRAKRYRAEAAVFTCRECGAQWCKVPWTRQHRHDFCSRNCKLRFEYHATHPDAPRRGGRS